MAVGNDSVKTDFVQVGGLELQHLEDTSTVDRVCSLLDLLGSTVSTTEAGTDQLLAVLVEQVESGQVGAGGDLDQLCESVSDLSLGKSAEEAEVKEGVHRSVVGTETVLVVAVVDGDLDRDGGIDQTNDGGGNTNVVGVTAVGGASKTARKVSQSVLYDFRASPLGMVWKPECLEVIFGGESCVFTQQHQ